MDTRAVVILSVLGIILAGVVLVLACNDEPQPTSASRTPVQFSGNASRWQTPTPAPTRIRTQPTRVPTRAWTQLPTPGPTAAPVPTPAGLGISRREFRAVYEDVGLTCHGGLPVAEYGKGYETWRCDTPLGSPLDVELELAGQLWDDDVVYSRLFIYEPNKDGSVAAVHAALFLQSALPRWPDSIEWVDTHMLDAVDGQLRSVSHGDSVLTIQWSEGPLFVIQVRGR